MQKSYGHFRLFLVGKKANLGKAMKVSRMLVNPLHAPLGAWCPQLHFWGRLVRRSTTPKFQAKQVKGKKVMLILGWLGSAQQGPVIMHLRVQPPFSTGLMV